VKGPLLVFAVFVGLTGTIAHADGQPTLHILLNSPEVTRTTRTVLIREATRIWKGAGIRLEWPAPTSRPAGLVLRVRTVEKTTPAGTYDASVLGELVRGAGTNAVAMVAIDRAAAIATRGSVARGGLHFDERLGLILGRAVAHEIGHFLTGSLHQRDGLMRAHFRENELADPWSTAFTVDAAMETVARATVANGFPRRVPAAPLPAVTIEPD
jgi:hypothetical protein